MTTFSFFKKTHLGIFDVRENLESLLSETSFYSFFFLCLQVLRLYITLWVMTDLNFLYLHALAWLLPFIYSFLFGLTFVTAITTTFGFSPPRLSETSDYSIDCKKKSPTTWLIHISRISSFLLIKFLFENFFLQMHTANLFESFPFMSFIYIFIQFPTKTMLEKGVLAN